VERPRYPLIAADLRTGIAAGTFPPGSRLPGENDLMMSYGVARATARKALDVIVREGLAEARQGAGTFVRVTRPAMPFEKLMAHVAGLGEADWERSLAELAARVGEPAGRFADAQAAVRVCRAGPVEILAVMHPLVRRAVDADRGGVASGGLGSMFDSSQEG
jgi:DNA-binding transcriptional MocR family regulator